VAVVAGLDVVVQGGEELMLLGLVELGLGRVWIIARETLQLLV
jgi:hypothetical protein